MQEAARQMDACTSYIYIFALKMHLLLYTPRHSYVYSCFPVQFSSGFRLCVCGK